MDSGKKTIKELFDGNKIYNIPCYQRGYAWTDSQLKDFYEDFYTHTQQTSNYYYGSLLLHEVRKDEGEYEYFEIVDGQQRITTLIIFVYCLIKRMKELNYNSEKTDKLYKSFIKNIDSWFILSLQSDDDNYFKTRILSEQSSNFTNTPSQNRLLNAKKKFTELLSNIDDVQQLEDFKIKINNSNVLVFLVNSQREASMIFETINDRGKPLTNLEKTKSYLMYKASVLNINAEQIINSLQNKFNQIYRDYSEIEDVFTDENSILQYAFIAYSKWGSSQKFKKEYQHYMEVMKDKVEAFIKKGKKQELNDYIEEYTNHIQSTFETLKSMMKNPCNNLENILFIGNIANFYPMLIKCYNYDKTENKDYFSKICHLCEIFSFRFYVILDYQSNRAQTTWYNLARDFKGDFKDLIIKLIKLIEKESNEEKFIEKLTMPNFYEEYESKDRNYFFWKYENWLRENEQPTATPMPHSDLTEKVNKKLRLTIEHIVAQRNGNEKSRIITDNLCVQVGQANKFDREYLHSIGNLTLDPQSANSSKGKNDVEAKMNKYFIRAPYKCQNELMDFLETDGKNQKWTIQSIENRKNKLIKFAKAEWCDFSKFN